MGQVESTTIHNHLVYRDNLLTWRWFDAIGPSVCKYELNVAGCPTDDATGMPTEFTNTLVNASTFAHTDVLGGAVLLTTAGANNDGVKLQLGDELGGAGESVSFAAEYPTYFGVRFCCSDVDDSDILAGFCVTDTTCLDGVDTAVYFRTVDGSDQLYFVLERDTVESATAVATLTDGTYVHCEFLYSGSNIYVYVDDTLMATIADTDANFPNDELMRLTLEFLQGAVGAHTLTVTELRYIQIQA